MMETEFTITDYLDQYSGPNLFFRAEHLIRGDHPRKLDILKFVLKKEADSGIFL
jgi:hypothetical protein